MEEELALIAEGIMVLESTPELPESRPVPTTGPPTTPTATPAPMPQVVETLTPSEEFTVEFVEQAIQRYDGDGREATVSYYNTTESTVGDWYIFIVDEDETLIANRDQSLLGKHIDEVGNTVDWEKFSDLDVTEDGRWVDYLFVNPATGGEGLKHSWVVLHDGLVFGSGWYESLPESTPVEE